MQCKSCNGSGQSGFATVEESSSLDCSEPGCEAAEQRTAFEKWFRANFDPRPTLKDWFVYQHGVSTGITHVQAGNAQALADSNLALMEQTELADALRQQAETLEAELRVARAALEEYVNNSQEHDVGGGDVVIACCESREMAIKALGRAESIDITKEWSEHMAKAEIEADCNIGAGAAIPPAIEAPQGEWQSIPGGLQRLVLPDAAPAVEAPQALSFELPPLPEMEGLQDIQHALNTPDDWDADYANTWSSLQVAERNKMQWRVYALKLRSLLAAVQPAAAPAVQVQPIGEIATQGRFVSNVEWYSGMMPPIGTKIYTAPSPAQEQPVEALHKRIKFLEKLVDAYSKKSYQYDIEHPNDGLNTAAETQPPADAAPYPDTVRMDYLVGKIVEVREELRYGSRLLYVSQARYDDDEFIGTTLREQIDAALAAKPAE